MFDWLEYFMQIPIYLVNSLIEVPIISVPIFLLFTYGLTKKTIRRSHINNQRTVSDFQCSCCGEPILERDVFCKNCQTITPKVQEMLDHNSDKKPDFYCSLDNGYKLRCPHCKLVYRSSKDLFPPERYSSPVKYCANCHNYFLDASYIEWSVSPLHIKLLEFFPIGFFVLFTSVSCLIISFIANGDWLMAQEFTFLFLTLFGIRSAFVLAQHKIIHRNTFHESNMRLKQNPEYPQILINMGYGKMMDKKYHHLSKEIIVNRKDKLKELLKEAFTFD